MKKFWLAGLCVAGALILTTVFWLPEKEYVAKVGDSYLYAEELNALAAKAPEVDSKLLIESWAENELLLQYAVHNKLYEANRAARSAMIRATLDEITRFAPVPDANDLKLEYAKRVTQLTVPAMLRLQRHKDSNSLSMIVPERWFRLSELGTLLSESSLERLLDAARSKNKEWLELSDFDSSEVQVKVLEYREASTPSFESVRDSLEKEWLNRKQAEQVRESLANMKQQFQYDLRIE